jgi:putative oxygen-independent coproporphyrinogen III oxidase
LIAFKELPELALYVHLPWCVRKCPYCDFNSHERADALPEAEYVSALLTDLEMSLPQVWGRPISSIFIGGGTPSLFTPRAIDTLLSGVRARVKVLPMAEITLEANPGTFEVDRFQGFRDAGVTRVSIGVQSFNAHHLQLLGRIHDADQARAAVAAAVERFDRVNVDLMFGLPGQDMDALGRDLDTALALGTTHVSCYQLTMEPNTAFARRPPGGLPDDDELADMQSVVIERLAARGFARYEISAYAKPGHACRHNLNYWTFGDYVGIGAGAHGKISMPDRIVRTTRLRHPEQYMASIARGEGASQAEVGVEALAFEFMMNGLRLTDGVPVGRWRQTTGMELQAHPFLLDRISEAQRKGLLARDPGVFRATDRGLELLNDLQSIFLN